MTQLELAKEGTISPEMEEIARREGVSADFVREGIVQGRIVIPANKNHKNLVPCGIGSGLRVKVNANIGTSPDFSDIGAELNKLEVAAKSGADTIMDLSTGGDIKEIRQTIIASSKLPVGTVPIYQAAVQAISLYGAITKMTIDGIFDVIEEQASDGVDFMTIHAGVTREVIGHLRKRPRLADVVSRGGVFMIGWMLQNKKENPLYEHFDRLLEIARKYDVTLSLGDGLRPGSVADASDQAQIAELLVLGELVKVARGKGVQVMVEGPGHMPLDQIEANVRLEKSICSEAPFYVLGPLVTDIGAGYDHITGAIGGALAATAGADFLCYVTPAEHLSLPDAEDVRQGVIASRIAAHAADIVRGIPGAIEWDRKMALARKRFDWEEQARLSLDPDHFLKAHQKVKTKSVACSMCGEFCAMELAAEYLSGEKGQGECLFSEQGL